MSEGLSPSLDIFFCFGRGVQVCAPCDNIYIYIYYLFYLVTFSFPSCLLLLTFSHLILHFSLVGRHCLVSHLCLCLLYSFYYLIYLFFIQSLISFILFSVLSFHLSFDLFTLLYFLLLVSFNLFFFMLFH